MSAAGRSRLSCLCRGSVTANCAPLCTPWPWQAAWHFGEACPDTALPKSRELGPWTDWENAWKPRGTDTSASFSSGVEHLESIYLPSSPSSPSFTAISITRAQGCSSSSKGDESLMAWDSGMFPISLILLMLNIITAEILFWSAPGLMRDQTNCKHLAAVMEPLSSHHCGTSSLVWLRAFSWWP